MRLQEFADCALPYRPERFSAQVFWRGDSVCEYRRISAYAPSGLQKPAIVVSEMRDEYEFHYHRYAAVLGCFPMHVSFPTARRDPCFRVKWDSTNKGFGSKESMRVLPQFEPADHWSGAEQIDEKGMKTLRIRWRIRCYGNYAGLLR